MILFIKSIIVGICALLPGVSGSVVAVSFGIYDKFLETITDLSKVKQNIKFLLIVIVGVISGMYIASNILIYIFKYRTIIYYILIGIIMSEVPFLVKNIHINTEKKVMPIPLILAFVFSLLLDFFNTNNKLISYSSFKYFIGGILFSFGKVFPGISSSFFLLCLGIYENIIILVNKPLLLIYNFNYYLPFIIGTILGFILFIKILSFLMKNYYRLVYSMILGFILSSVIVLLPNFSLDFSNVIGIILMIVTFIVFIKIKIKEQ